jgi:hypothetical protein
MHIRFFAYALLLILQQPSISQAAFIVDTGPPELGGNAWSLASDQFLGGEFSVTSTWIVTGIRSWAAFGTERIGPNDERPSATAVISASNGVSFVPLNDIYSTEFSLRAGPGPGWTGPENLAWILEPGTYWITYQLRPGQFSAEGLLAYSPKPLLRENIFGGESSSSFSWRSGKIVGPRGLGLAWQIEGYLANSVPEPATWSVMLLGFGLIGTTIRLKRRREQIGNLPALFLN